MGGMAGGQFDNQRKPLPFEEAGPPLGCTARQPLAQQLHPGGQRKIPAGPTSTLIPCAGLGTSGDCQPLPLAVTSLLPCTPNKEAPCPDDLILH